MVRGFALFGVLLVNMYNFGANHPIWTGLADQAAFSVMRIFFETKSWRLFSFLFGLGFSFQLLSAQRRGRSLLSTYSRRLTVLFLIGMAHALFYDGDILMLYAELGLVLVLFARVQPRLLLALSIAVLALFPIGGAIEALGDRRVDFTTTQQVALPEADEPGPYVDGSVLDVMLANSAVIPPNPLAGPLEPESALAVFAMFLLGLYAGQRRIFQDLEAHLPLVRAVSIWGLGLGLLGMATERTLALGWGYSVFGDEAAAVWMQVLGDSAFAYGSTALSMGYAAMVVLAARSSPWRRLVTPLAPVGRLALTVYLTQTLAFTTLFYGYGLGQIGRIGPAGVTAWAIVIFGAQVVACQWWVRHYRFGPVEWLWRSLTYLRVPSIRA